MCQVAFTIETGDNKEPIQNRQGRYRNINNSSWTNFNVDTDNSLTPEISINGDYELEVRVSYKAMPTEADWSPWKRSTFQVVEDGCDSVYYYAGRDQTIGTL